MAVIMTLLSSYFFVADKTYLSDFMKKYLPKSVNYRFNLIRNSFRDAVGGYFKAQFKIEVWVYPPASFRLIKIIAIGNARIMPITPAI